MPHSEEEALAFWSKRHASYPLLSPLAEDLSASQAYVERVFSVCGWLTAGRGVASSQPHHQEPGETCFCENEPRTVVTVMSADLLTV